MSVNGSAAYAYTYDENGTLISKKDIKTNTFTTYVINENGSTTVTVKDNDTVTDCYTISKDSTQFTDTVGTHTYGKTGNSEGTLDSFTYDSNSIYNKACTLNSDKAITSEKITDASGDILSTTYTYDAAGNITALTNTTTDGTEETSYTYDSFGNIETISLNGTPSYHYYYDIADELVRVDDTVKNETVTYTYDKSGNILSVNTYDYTTDSLDGIAPSDTITYEYNNSQFPDELTSYNGQDITYDELGNPLTYLGWSMTWEAGRSLSSMNNGIDNITYTYDDNGIRTSKTVNGVTTTYTSIDGKITSQNDGTNTLYFRYDKNDVLTGFSLNGTEYVYVKNAQGDVTGILDIDGNQVVSYTYDAWGKVESVTGTMADTVGQINPMRYRGYYQDAETGLYYLQSRYYDSVVERFINADEPALIDVLASSEAGANLFAYCGNNGVNKSDESGYWSLWSAVKKVVNRINLSRAYHIAHGVFLITTGLLAIVSSIRSGYVASALGTITARIVGSLVTTALGLMPLGQYWGTIIAITTLLSVGWRLKAVFFNVTLGYNELKAAL